jgi:hypothetical protein
LGKFRTTICDDAPTPTPVMSLPSVMAVKESAPAEIRVPIVSGIVVAASAARRPRKSAIGPIPKPPRNPPATKTDTTAPFAPLFPANPKSSAICESGALITALWYLRCKKSVNLSDRARCVITGGQSANSRWMWETRNTYPNRNAPRHAVATDGNRPGPMSSRCHGSEGGRAFSESTDASDDGFETEALKDEASSSDEIVPYGTEGNPGGGDPCSSLCGIAQVMLVIRERGVFAERVGTCRERAPAHTVGRARDATET